MASFKSGRESNIVLRIYFKGLMDETARKGRSTLRDRIAFKWTPELMK